MIEDLIAGIASTGASAALRGQAWIIPALQSLHILLVAALAGAAVLLALRVLRDDADQAPLRRVIWLALPGLLASGLLLILAEPERQIGNPAFTLKLALLAVALVLLARPGRSRPARRVTATLSLAVWAGIAVAGRWIAYLGEG
ncbi:hypothetical protein [Falsiroseomonas ponticola]|uniref:hypothetical protein n=1 Tax=Falsiroseomonas ponticola TaxID=2786951 RepID=UPI00193475AF|nr:hypothetical protein [Roseomonas ponticola]